MLWPRIGQYVLSMLEKESVNNKGRDGGGEGGISSSSIFDPDQCVIEQTRGLGIGIGSIT